MKHLIIALLCLSSGSVFSQKNSKEIKYDKIYYNGTKYETDALNITIVDAVSTDAEIKFKIRLTNKSGDFLLYKPEESKFVIDGKESAPTEKWVEVEPFGTATRVINLKGPGYNKIKNYSFQIEGLYRIPASKKGIPASDFKLPATQNQLTVGKFDVSMDKVEKETDKTFVKFKCTYSGEQIGVIYPSRISVKMPDGNDYATILSTAKPILVNKGETVAFLAKWDRMPGGAANDMQKVEMLIRWNDTFTENSIEKMKGTALDITFDEKTSNEKGR